jgi:hypothetical protein
MNTFEQMGENMILAQLGQQELARIIVAWVGSRFAAMGAAFRGVFAKAAA